MLSKFLIFLLTLVGAILIAITIWGEKNLKKSFWTLSDCNLSRKSVKIIVFICGWLSVIDFTFVALLITELI